MGFLATAGIVASIFVVGDTRSALSSPPAVMRLDPSTIKLDGIAGTIFTVDVVIEGVTDLGAFEFQIQFDPDFVKLVDVHVGPFLGSTNRDVVCQQSAIAVGLAELGCNTQDPAPPGPDGSGVVASVDFSVQGLSGGETHLLLKACNAGNVLGTAILSDTCKGSKVTINLPTPTLTPTPPPPRQFKLPVLQNLFLTRQGQKIPPVQCVGPQSGNDVAVLTERLSLPITSLLAAFEFEVRFDEKLVCVELEPGPAAANMTCTVEDATNSALQGVARIGCVTTGKDGPFPDTTTPVGRHLANILVRPQPEVYSQAKPNQGNGIAVQLLNQGCQLSDVQGYPIEIFSCEDADLTIRYLEGDVEPDCVVDSVDTQAIAFRWGSSLGTLIYSDRFNLEPSGTQADDDIDINDLQFVYGRFGSTCADPHPPQAPVNPKGGPTPTTTPTPTPTATPPGETKPGINKSPNVRDLILNSPATQPCQDSPDAVTFEVMVKNPITSPDPKNPAQLQQLGAFGFETRFDPLFVCIEISPGDIPQGEMSCLTIQGDNYVRFGCTAMAGETPPTPQPPGILAVITVRPQPGVYALLVPGAGDEIVTQLFNEGCGLSDLLGHPIKSSGCDGATVIIRYP